LPTDTHPLTNSEEEHNEEETKEENLVNEETKKVTEETHPLTNSEEETTEENLVNKKKVTVETYKGMKVEQLRTLVIQRGLEPKNLKKHELIDLLTSQ